MRESFGGTMIFWIVLVLFSVFISFTAIIIKYARVYKIKNSVINYINKKDGAISHLEIDQRLKEMGYQEDGTYKICRYFPSDKGEFYYLELYSVTAMPIVGSWMSVRSKIKGETRVIKLTDDNTNLQSSGTNNGWFSGTSDQCYVCVLGQTDQSLCTSTKAE